LNQKGDIKETLKVYQTIFRIDPDIANIRVYIAICFHHLGMLKEARASIKRALEKDPQNVVALALSSIMDMNQSKDQGLSKEEILKFKSSSNQSIQAAFKLNPKNSTVALEMARRFFEKGLYQKVLFL
jgi:tetratricopeptide (TPR) repeat protein